MNDRRLPTLARWPFYVADAVLVCLAIWIFRHYPHPLPFWPATLIVLCVAGAALLALWPYRTEYRTALRLAEADRLTDTVGQIGKLEEVGEQIRQATSQWQGVQEHSTSTIDAAREISDKMASEAQAFAGFMEKTNDAEKSTLRLEVEKLRRDEGQWLQVLVHVLDHVFALHQAGSRSGQESLHRQLSQFQEACRDIARRVGLTPVEAAVDGEFDPENHQVVEGQPEPACGAIVAETLATGYTFQGRLLRRCVVALRQPDQQGTTETEPTGQPGSVSSTAQAGPAEPSVDGDFVEPQGSPATGVSAAAAAAAESAELAELAALSEEEQVPLAEAAPGPDVRAGAAAEDGTAGADESFRLESEDLTTSGPDDLRQA